MRIGCLLNRKIKKKIQRARGLRRTKHGYLPLSVIGGRKQVNRKKLVDILVINGFLIINERKKEVLTKKGRYVGAKYQFCENDSAVSWIIWPECFLAHPVILKV